MEQLEIPVIDTFQEAHDLAGAVMENINRAGYTKPTPVQKHALPILVAGHDIMACAQTGSGKTAAFLFPMISVILKKGGNSDRGARCSYPAGLILAPTRELVQQIYDEARKFCYKTGLRCAVAYGGGENIRDQLRAVEMGADIVVAAPGRLVDFMERGKVRLSDVKFLTLDEADRMLDMGFEPQIRQIVEGSDMPPSGQRQTLLFSATFPREVQRLAQDFLDRAFATLTVGRVGAATDSIVQKILFARDHQEKPHLLVDVLMSQGVEGNRVLVFVATKREADMLEDFLYKEGFPATSIHGDRTQPEREQALKSFRAGREKVLVATDVCARAGSTSRTWPWLSTTTCPTRSRTTCTASGARAARATTGMRRPSSLRRTRGSPRT